MHLEGAVHSHDMGAKVITGDIDKHHVGKYLEEVITQRHAIE